MTLLRSTKNNNNNNNIIIIIIIAHKLILKYDQVRITE